MGTLHHVEKRIDQGSTSVDSTTFSTITNGTTNIEILPSELKLGRTYLILAQTNLKSAATNNKAQCRLVQVDEAGTFQGLIEGSKQDVGIADTNDAENYFFWHVYPALTNGVALQISRDATAGAITAYHTTLIALDITEREYFFNQNKTDTTLGTSFSTANNASITFTPQASQTWLLLFTQQFQTNGGTSSTVEARADFTDVPNKLYFMREGASTTTRYVGSWGRPFTFSAATEQTVDVDARTTNAAQAHTREYSAVFAMGLSSGASTGTRFNFQKFDYKDTPILANQTNYGDIGAEVDWQSGDYTGTEDVIVLSMAHAVPNGVGRSIRLGVDDGGGTFYRTGTGTDAQQLGNPNDNTDEFPVFDLFLSNINNTAKQWDALMSVDHPQVDIDDRFIVVFSTAGYHDWDDYVKIVFAIDEKSLWTEGELDTLDTNAAQRIKDEWTAEMTSTPTFVDNFREHADWFNFADSENQWQLYPKVHCLATDEPDKSLDDLRQHFNTVWATVKANIETEVQAIRATTIVSAFWYHDPDYSLLKPFP